MVVQLDLRAVVEHGLQRAHRASLKRGTYSGVRDALGGVNDRVRLLYRKVSSTV